MVACARRAPGTAARDQFRVGAFRTADIDQTIVLGAHGPYRVHIVLVHA